MADSLSPGVKVKPPTPLLLKPLKVKDWPGLFQSLAKFGHNLAKMEFETAFADVLKALNYVTFRDKPEELAWMLIHRAMTQAVGVSLSLLIREDRTEFMKRDWVTSAHQLDEKLYAVEVTLDQAFFDHPGWCPYVRQVCRRAREWLIAAGVSESAADRLTERIPSEFTIRLSHEWMTSQNWLKGLMPEMQKTPFTPAVEAEFAWVYYAATLQEQANRRLFDEEFGVRAVYVSLRAYTDRNDGDTVTRMIGMVEDMLDQWLEAGRADDDVRVVEGDPGAGKSTLARIYAADRFGRIFGGRRWRTVFAPLHHSAFQEERPLDQSVAAYYESIGVSLNAPLDRECPDPTLLILDGLDELSRAGHVGLDVIRAFVETVAALKDRWNEGRKDARLLVLMCGRPIAADVARKVVRRPEVVLNLLPFVFDPTSLKTTAERKKAVLAGRTALLGTDQRAEWWHKYATARGRPPTPEAYEEIKKNPSLTPITAQPLLNYLVAFLRESSPDAKLPDNLCALYGLLLRRVHERGWDRRQVPTLGRMEFADFCTLLEEVAITAWHSGETRSIRVSAVEDRLTPEQKDALGQLEKTVKDGVLRLLLGFFLRPRGHERGDELYEFTHKSFAEYLIACRIASTLNELTAQGKGRSQRRRDDAQALVEWAELFGPQRIDNDILHFVEEEGKSLGKDTVEGWRVMLGRLLETVIRDGMPMHLMITKIKPEPTFRLMDEWALNAEFALLRSLEVCLRLTGKRTEVRSLADVLGHWLGGRWSPLMEGLGYGFLCLANADLSDANLRRANLNGADLSGANLSETNLSGANLNGADLSGANLYRASLYRANLIIADLSGADLSEANLSGANLYRVNLSKASISGAFISEADLSGADLSGADLSGADLSGADLSGADLSEALVTIDQLRATTGEPDIMPDGEPPPKNWRKAPATPRKRATRKLKTAPPTPEPPTTETTG